MRTGIFVLAGCLVSAGCSVGPKYKTPSALIPPAFKEQPPAAFKEWQASNPKDDKLRGNWWELFGDLQLNALEEQVNISNQNVAQAEAQFRGARAAIRAARSQLFPTISAGPSVTETHSSANSIGGGVSGAIPVTTGTTSTGIVRGGNYSNYQIPFEFSYELDAWGRIRHLVEASVDTTQANAADVETARLSAHAELATDYFQLRGSDQSKKLLDDTVTDYEKQLQLTMQRREGGVATQLDVEQARTQLETARAQAIDLAVLRAQYEHAIAVLTGKPPATLTLVFNPATVSPPVIPIGIPSELLERRPDIAAAERTVAAQNAQIGVAEAAFYPNITLSATAGLAGSSLTTLFAWPSRIWSVGPALAQTLFDAGNRRALKAEAVATYDADVAVYRQNVLTAFQDVEDNLAALRVLSDEAVQEQRAVQAAERAFALSTERYKGGVATYLDVITSETALFTNRSTAVGILTRRMTASIALVKALGGGWDISQLPSGKNLVSKQGQNAPSSTPAVHQ